MKFTYNVGNKAKGQISKWVFQEIKACQIFRKTNISYPLILTRTCAYQGLRNVRFSENLVCFVVLKHPFWDSPFCLITNNNKHFLSDEPCCINPSTELFYAFSSHMLILLLAGQHIYTYEIIRVRLHWFNWFGQWFLLGLKVYVQESYFYVTHVKVLKQNLVLSIKNFQSKFLKTILIILYWRDSWTMNSVSAIELNFLFFLILSYNSNSI